MNVIYAKFLSVKLALTNDEEKAKEFALRMVAKASTWKHDVEAWAETFIGHYRLHNDEKAAEEFAERNTQTFPIPAVPAQPAPIADPASADAQVPVEPAQTEPAVPTQDPQP